MCPQSVAYLIPFFSGALPSFAVDLASSKEITDVGITDTGGHTYVHLAEAMRHGSHSLLRKESGTQKDAPDLLDVYARNQLTRNSIKSWITPDIMKRSVFTYGWPKPSLDELSKDTGKNPIQHDFLSQLGARIAAGGQQVKYMEIGVSVLKGVHTQSKFFQNAVITSFDIEDPNPVIEGLWTKKKAIDQWDVSDTRKKFGRKSDYINQYVGPNSNNLYYLAGDAFSGTSWDHLQRTIVGKHGSFNLILSDAFHTGKAVKEEVDSMISRGMIKPGKDFAIVWDDCNEGGSIAPANREHNFPKLRSLFAGQATCSGSFVIPGWVGQNEFSHNTCVFTTLDLSGPHLGASKTWMPEKNDVTCSPAA